MLEANKALVRRWFEEVWNKGRVEAIEEMFAADAAGQSEEVSFVCRTKPKADYSALQDILPREQE